MVAAIYVHLCTTRKHRFYSEQNHKTTIKTVPAAQTRALQSLTICDFTVYNMEMAD